MRADTRERAFDRKTKLSISIRDSVDGWPCCVFCGAPAPMQTAWSNAHYIGRAQGGLGIEENGLTLCPGCHRRYDQTTARQEMRGFFRAYLEERYPGWSEERLVQRKAGQAGD